MILFHYFVFPNFKFLNLLNYFLKIAKMILDVHFLENKGHQKLFMTLTADIKSMNCV